MRWRWGSLISRLCGDAASEGRRHGRPRECLFFTLGGAQVGAGAIVGWRDVIQPALSEVKLWPFDGDLVTLLATPGVTVAEIYPAEAYSHLGVSIGTGTGKHEDVSEGQAACDIALARRL